MSIHHFKRTFLFLITLIPFSVAHTQSVGINTSGATPDASAILDLNSTNKGLLIPRVTDTNSVSSPSMGLLLFSNNDSTFYYYTGTKWVYLVNNETINTTTDYGLYPTGSVFCNGTPTEVVDVFNPVTGETWMDRNLGATRVALNLKDFQSFGDLYQWGRGADGHQCYSSAQISSPSTNLDDQPGHGHFLRANGDWKNPANNSLWQGTNGTNNPCPSGYRLPTEAELEAERASWSSNDATGAFASPLKIPVTGRRNDISGDFVSIGSVAYYWSSTVSGNNARYLNFQDFSNSASIQNLGRAYGASVRCIKD